MSSNLPPSPPPGPDQSAPDYLQSGDPGRPDDPPRRSKGRRIAAIGGGIGLVVLVGGGVWAWNFWFSQGPQPSEALPTNTLAYVSIDMDPTGEQKAEFIEIAREFPVFEDEFGFDLDTKDDVKKWIFEEIQREEDVCGDLEYDDDLKPWLGDRFAFAVVDRDEEDPVPVVVVQVTDEDKAVEGLESLFECAADGGTGEDELSGYAFNGDWVILAETEEIAEEVVEATDDESLADDEDFKELTEEAGDPGVLTAYAAPEAGQALMDAAGDDLLDELAELGGVVGGDDFADEFRRSLEGFGGAAGSLRFDDGALELEFVGGEFEGELEELAPFDAVEIGQLVSELPEASAAAMALGIPDGYVDTMLEVMRPVIEAESGLPYDEAIAGLEEASGLSIPEDVNTLLGDAVAVVVDSDIDADELDDEGPAALRAAVLVQGDPEEIEGVLDKLRATIGPDDAQFLLSASEGDLVAIGSNADYLEEVVSGGDLGDDAVFREVVPHGDDSSVVLYVDFDRQDWLVELAEETGADDEVVDNLDPLGALGLSAWEDDGYSHFLLKLTTD